MNTSRTGRMPDLKRQIAMKKIALVALLLSAITQAATAGEKEAADALYDDAKPLSLVGPFLDSKGCLWGLDEKHGSVSLVQITVAGRQVCHKFRK